MSSKSFIITEHWSPCQHFREYPHGAKRDDALLELAVKEYQPRNNLNVGEDPITIIAAHGNGFPKVRYTREPIATCSANIQRKLMSLYSTNS